jgi:hypothetical protein
MKDKSFKFSFNDKFAIAIVWFSLALFAVGTIINKIDQQNRTLFLEFTKNSTPSGVEKIEIQKVGQFGNGIGEVITIGDEDRIGTFVSALKTVQELKLTSSDYPSQETKVRVRVWQREKGIIEFQYYTVKDNETVFIGNIWMKSKLFGFGNGNANFSTPEFYNWLVESGAPIQN